ncbi:methyl-coenzyme M reductase operon protein D [Candidatus Methanocrinis natronophilus]|uniref:Methyl-coenzyme M reductase operon protein D n=1 Tax=Candidatus Methanocrinis natronophilus TaxID=3033396 RepID=A0ABT5X857_9EURY|nr:methyl-coenzyme M reductase operon protein D [Candidatus Methanocrinis natronophilus]MDF0590868.1 methyl-coenzyme M reductase operon protein D [Candidatus Methanocrinis natronophilus]
MVTKSDTETVQIEIFPRRFLNPDTAQRLLDEIYRSGGVLRIMIQGPNLPRAVPYGPGKGLPIEEHKNMLLELGDQAIELRVKVGRIGLELESEEDIEGVRAACERTLPFSFDIKKRQLFHTKPTVSDYAKYGSEVEDKRILGMVDPKAKKERNLAMLSDSRGDS